MSSWHDSQRPGVVLQLAARAAIGEAEERLDELGAAATSEAKVAALLEVGDSFDQMRGRPYLQLQSGPGSGGAVAAEEAAMRWFSDALTSLARRHGVYEQFSQEIIARRGETGLGSGLEGAPLDALTCANVDAGARRWCSRPATLACSACRLVAYCGADCQAQHRSTHRVDCKSHLAATPYVPGWAREGRPPSFMSSGSQGCALDSSRRAWPAAQLWQLALGSARQAAGSARPAPPTPAAPVPCTAATPSWSAC